MAVLIDWKLVSERDRKRKLKPKKVTSARSNVWKIVWWIYKLELFEWKIIKENENSYIINARNRKTKSNRRLFTIELNKDSLTFNK